VLAICRGMQLFNVAHGGTLIQHLDNSTAARGARHDPALPAHQILVEPGTRLAAILGEAPMRSIRAIIRLSSGSAPACA
jgi:putative glutamine amidotransferase